MSDTKQALADAFLELVPDGAVIGLGSGSTLAIVIRTLGQAVTSGRIRVTGVPTSYQSRLLARDVGIPLAEPHHFERIDLAVDGADEVDPHGDLIKGAGGAHVLEKLTAAMAGRCTVLVDETKRVDVLGRRHPVPVDVLPDALGYVSRRLRELGGRPEFRTGSGKVGPVISDLGHPMIDAWFDAITDPVALDRQINSIPGVVGHGLFVRMADLIITARETDEGIVIQKDSY